MRAVREVRVGSWNLHNGGLDGGDDARLWRQVDLLAEQDLDLIGLQEAKWGPRGGRLVHEVAHRLGMPGRFRVPSNHHGCDLVMLVREGDGLRVLEERHDTSGAWWHALGNLRLWVAGVGEVEFLNAHLAPSAPSRRASEGEAFGLFRNSQVIAVGDFNAVAAMGDDPDGTGIDPEYASAKLDKRPAVAMRAAGFQDAATCIGGAHSRMDETPTVGHGKADRLAYRCDRILFNNLPVEALDYKVVPAVANAQVPDRQALSDHHLVVAELLLRREVRA